MLENFSAIKVENPSDKIIRQIKDLISSGQIVSGQKLPPERKLAEKFGVGRTVVRDAIRKLEFYGIVRTYPQSGTVVSGLGITALEGLISDVLEIEETDFRSLVETRVLLEIEGAKKAAERRSPDDLIILQKALDAYEEKAIHGIPAIEEDLLFHLKIAEASKNKVLMSLLLVITPDILKNYNALKVCSTDSNKKIIMEHREIMRCIREQDIIGVEKAMRLHLKDVSEFSASLNT